MKIKSFVGVVLAVLVAIFGGGCASRQMSQMDTRERVEIPVLLDGKVYTNSFERTDRSKIAPGGPRVIHHGGGGNLFHFHATMGGGGVVGGPYGYGSGGGPYTYGTHGAVTATGWPVVTVPVESQGYFQNQTMQRYGFGGGGSPQSSRGYGY